MTGQADRRRAFAAPGGSHDRLVRFLARALPAAIGVIAAVMVLSPLSPRGEISFLLDRNKVAVTQERLRLDNADYRGTDSAGRRFMVTAGAAVQRTARDPIVEMEKLVASMTMTDGEARLTAPRGIYNFEAESLEVDGPVNFTAADGYSLVTSKVSIDLATRRMAGSGGVSGTVPSGTFSADRLFVDLPERTVRLEGNARLRMVPGKFRMP